MTALPTFVTAPNTGPEPTPLGLLRALAASPGALLLHEGSRTTLAAEPEEVVQVTMDQPRETLIGALDRILAGEPDALWALALTYEAGRALMPEEGRGSSKRRERLAETPGLPRLIAMRYPAWVELDAAGLRLRGQPEARETLAQRLGRTPDPGLFTGGASGALDRDLDQTAYAERFAAVQEDLRAGRYYQLNLTCAHRTGWQGHPLTFFERLTGHQLPLRAGYLDAGPFVIASASPELLLDYDPRTRLAVSGPIKGTAAAPEDPRERERLFDRLVADPKERAEHIMIVDLTRNDLGRVCVPGTVRPRRLFESLHTGPVQHLVTQVEGTLAPGRTASDLLTALFPGGSVTGAPKIAAMRSIDALEVAPRGFYCGALGRVGPGGELSLTLPIRTATLQQDDHPERWRVTYPSGGGIVAGAPMARELEELELKAERLRRALS